MGTEFTDLTANGRIYWTSWQGAVATSWYAGSPGKQVYALLVVVPGKTVNSTLPEVWIGLNMKQVGTQLNYSGDKMKTPDKMRATFQLIDNMEPLASLLKLLG